MKKLVLLILLFSCLHVIGREKAENWLIKLNSADIGYVEFYMTYTKSTKDGHNYFTAHSAKNGSKRVMGISTFSLSNLFSKKFYKGPLVKIVNGITTYKNDSTKLKGNFISTFGNYNLIGFRDSATLTAFLITDDSTVRGTITGVLVKKSNKKINNYAEIAKASLSITKKNIYSPTIPTTKNWEKFEEKILKVSKKTKDDLEFITAFHYYANKFEIPSVSLIRKCPNNIAPIAEVDTAYISLKHKTSNTAYIKINSFAVSAKDIDSIFDIVNTRNYKNLIVDLRDNVGGRIESEIQFSRYLTHKPFYGGIFLTRKWFNNNTQPPAPTTYFQFTRFSADNFDLTTEGIHKKEVLYLLVEPHPTPYKGKVYILVNNKTANTCEPIIYGLKQNGLATIIGQPTAGSVLNGEYFSIDNNYFVIIPTADFYASDGYRIDQQGVTPNFLADEGYALEEALKITK